jgi:hypothetical protein
MVDLARLLVYGRELLLQHQMVDWAIVSLAFVGAFTASRLLEKLTIGLIHRLVSVWLVLVGLSLISGIL